MKKNGSPWRANRNKKYRKKKKKQKETKERKTAPTARLYRFIYPTLQSRWREWLLSFSVTLLAGAGRPISAGGGVIHRPIMQLPDSWKRPPLNLPKKNHRGAQFFQQSTEWWSSFSSSKGCFFSLKKTHRDNSEILPFPRVERESENDQSKLWKSWTTLAVEIVAFHCWFHRCIDLTATESWASTKLPTVIATSPFIMEQGHQVLASY